MTESQIQSAFFEWLSLHEKKHPQLALFYAIPNGANKSVSARMKFKREGLKSGVPDCHLPVAELDHHAFADGKCGLWIEFKTKRGVLSETQKEWIDKLTKAGHRVEVCRSWTDAANVTIDYLGLPIEKL